MFKWNFTRSDGTWLLNVVRSLRKERLIDGWPPSLQRYVFRYNKIARASTWKTLNARKNILFPGTWWRTWWCPVSTWRGCSSSASGKTRIKGTLGGYGRKISNATYLFCGRQFFFFFFFYRDRFFERNFRPANNFRSDICAQNISRFHERCIYWYLKKGLWKCAQKLRDILYYINNNTFRTTIRCIFNLLVNARSQLISRNSCIHFQIDFKFCQM